MEISPESIEKKQINLRIDVEVYDVCKLLADQREVSLPTFVSDALRQYLRSEDVQDAIRGRLDQLTGLADRLTQES